MIQHHIKSVTSTAPQVSLAQGGGCPSLRRTVPQIPSETSPGENSICKFLSERFQTGNSKAKDPKCEFSTASHQAKVTKLKLPC